ncbi:hypothetical protein FM106_03565 [Brachybacterium faecium]|nr:hypothetical protein FM106_03565 [Brachybacterium faecium]
MRIINSFNGHISFFIKIKIRLSLLFFMVLYVESDYFFESYY